jgi:hypothetical protein
LRIRGDVTLRRVSRSRVGRCATVVALCYARNNGVRETRRAFNAWIVPRGTVARVAYIRPDGGPRGLSPGQQAAIVASVQDWATAQTPGGNGSNQHGPKEQKCKVALLQTAAARAAKPGVSLRTQKMANAVAKADPELAKQEQKCNVALRKLELRSRPHHGHPGSSHSRHLTTDIAFRASNLSLTVHRR